MSSAEREGNGWARRRQAPGAGAAGDGLGNYLRITRHGGRDVRRKTRQDRRNEAYRWRSRLWSWSSLGRLRNCGRITYSTTGGPVLRISETEDGDRIAGLAGLQSCGSPWACPVCARRIAGRRARDVRHVVQAVAETDGCAGLVTLTMRHRAGMPLSVCWEALSAAWGAATSGAQWGRDKAALGVLGWCRTVEATYGEHGWHLHVHALLLFDSPTSVEAMTNLGHGMFSRWARALARRGFSAVEERGGLDVRAVRMTGNSLDKVSEYLAKITAEMTSPSTKDGRFGNRSPFAILRDALATGLADDCDLWLEWEKASHNRRQLTWSQGLREWARLGRERTDEEIVQQDMHGEDLLVIDPALWPLIREEVQDLLAATEIGGGLAAIRWLLSRGASP